MAKGRVLTTIDALRLDPQNRRKRTPRSRDLIVRSLKENGAARSIVIDETGVILAGNGVVDAATEAGIRKLRVIDASGDEIIAVRRRGLTQAQKRDLAISDNRTAELSEWDIEQLQADARDGRELKAFWSDDELADLFKGPGAPKNGKTDPDEIPATRGTSIVAGDVIELGHHRMICGDATKPDDVASLLAGAMIDLTITSPPYNVGMAYNSHRDKATRDVYLAFIEATARAFVPHMARGRFVAWNIGVSPKTFPAHQVVRLESVGLTFYRQIIWAKSGVPYPVFPTTVRTKRARHYHPNYVHEVIQVFETPDESDVQFRPCALCDGAGTMTVRELPSSEGHETIQLMVYGDEPEHGERIAPDHRYRNDVWQISQSQATVGLKTIGRKSTGLEHGGQRAHMVKEHPAAFPVELPRAVMGFMTTRVRPIWWQRIDIDGVRAAAPPRAHRRNRSRVLPSHHRPLGSLHRIQSAEGRRRRSATEEAPCIVAGPAAVTIRAATGGAGRHGSASTGGTGRCGGASECAAANRNPRH